MSLKKFNALILKHVTKTPYDFLHIFHLVLGKTPSHLLYTHLASLIDSVCQHFSAFIDCNSTLAGPPPALVTYLFFWIFYLRLFESDWLVFDPVYLCTRVFPLDSKCFNCAVQYTHVIWQKKKKKKKNMHFNEIQSQVIIMKGCTLTQRCTGLVGSFEANYWKIFSLVGNSGEV